MEEINGSLLENIEFLFKTCSKKYSIDYSEIIKKLYYKWATRIDLTEVEDTILKQIFKKIIPKKLKFWNKVYLKNK